MGFLCDGKNTKIFIVTENLFLCVFFFAIKMYSSLILTFFIKVFCYSHCDKILCFMILGTHCMINERKW